MVVSTAENRAQRALSFQNTPLSSVGQLQIWRSSGILAFPSNEDVAGWRGPATVVLVKPNGDIHIEWQETR
eukprot:12652769-Prorocentrum_lima.AAC.1